MDSTMAAGVLRELGDAREAGLGEEGRTRLTTPALV